MDGKKDGTMKGVAMEIAGAVRARAESVMAALRGGKRKTGMAVGVPAAIQRMGMRAEGLPKATPVNLRKLAESPMARKAINTIKDRIACMGWRVQLKAHAVDDGTAEQRALALTRMFEAPNPGDSMRTLLEQVLEDVIVGGFGAIEVQECEGYAEWQAAVKAGDGGHAAGTQITECEGVYGERKEQRSFDLGHAPLAQDGTSFLAQGDEEADAANPERRETQIPRASKNGGARNDSKSAEYASAKNPGRVPLQLWAVDGATVRINPAWDGKKESVRYAQDPALALTSAGTAFGAARAAGTSGSAAIQLRDEDLVYVRANPRTHTPFGLGRMEVAFEAVNALLSAGRYAGRLASNSVVQYALWLEKATPAEHDRLIRWWQDEIEGTGRVPLMTCEAKPEVLRFSGGTDAELRLQWQEFLVRVIAAAFDLPPMALGIEHDVNRSTAEQLADDAFRNAVRPTALLVAEHLTRDVIQKKLGWDDLEFTFTELESRDEMKELEIQLKLLTAGVVSVDEVRQWRGLGVSDPQLAIRDAEEQVAISN